MKIYFAGQDPIFELTDHHKAVIAYNINADELEKDMARRCNYWLHLPAEKHAWINRKHYAKKAKEKGLSELPLDHVQLARLSYEVDYQPQTLTCKVGDTEFQYKASHMLVNMASKEALKRDMVQHWDKTKGTFNERVNELKKGLHGYQGDFEKAEEMVRNVPNPEKDFVDAAIVAIGAAEDTERMVWILKHKYERCLERLKLEWNPKLASRGLTSIPADDVAYCNLVFSQPDYKDRKESDLDSQG